jgi:hypothetical protein
VFGAMNPVTGYRIFRASQHLCGEDFQAFLREVRQHYRGPHLTILLDSHHSHTANVSQALAAQLKIRLVWLPKRTPELNPMDTLWGHGKDAITVNKQYTSLDEQVKIFVAHLSGLSNKEALQTSGVLSENFWLKHVLSKNFPGPA